MRVVLLTVRVPPAPLTVAVPDIISTVMDGCWLAFFPCELHAAADKATRTTRAGTRQRAGRPNQSAARRPGPLTAGTSRRLVRRLAGRP
ncbi:MAG TPA: hypothetical protein VHA57_08410, partial [Actinomycetota bacterium]|nr:hypothetical protein [Actinomycetota bacterium]